VWCSSSDCIDDTLPPTLSAVSKTEHDMTSADADDALDLFADDDFDEALHDALDEADVELDVGDADADADADADGDDDAVDVEPAAVDADDDDGDDAAVAVAVADVDVDDELDDDLEDHDVDDVDEGGGVDVDEGGGVDLDDAELDDDDSTDAIRAQVDEALDTARIDDESDDDGTARHGIRPATTDVDLDDAADHFELPAIVPATPEPEVDPVVDRDALVDDQVVEGRDFVPAGDPDVDGRPDVDDDVSEEILEELRRADIDGPVVDFAPQDDTASARRRPRRRADYDPAPMPIPAQIPRVLGRKPRVRKVTRVVRHVDPWSVFKIALVAHTVLYVIVLTAGVLLWNVAHATGTVDNVERFFESFGWESFEFDGGEIYHAAWIAGLFGVIGLTGLAVLAATLFNLITDLVGGMRFTVLEEEVVETRVSPMRRFVVRRTEPEVPAVLRDQSGSMIREAVVDDTGANDRPSR
jgi:hypothetical protein